MSEIGLDQVNISTQTYNTLTRAGYKTLDDVLSLTNDEIISIKNLGRKQFEEVIGLRKRYRVDYENEIRSDERRKIAEWCKMKGYSCYDWRLLFEQYEKEQKYGQA